MSKVTALYHIVFCTKRREKTLPEAYLKDVYRFIWSIVRNHNSRLIRIGGIQNHVHMLLDLHPDVKLSELVRNIKSISSGWLNRDARFTLFNGWAREYFAETIGLSGMDSVIKYINAQAEHHNMKSLKEELEEMYCRAGFFFDEKTMFD